MSTTMAPARSPARTAVNPTAGSPSNVGVRRRRSVPRLIGGVVAALVGALVFGIVGLRADPGVDVLALARPVPAGTMISDEDLREVRIVADPSMQLFTAAERSAVVGRVAAVPLVAGSLLTPEHLGTMADPPPGQSIIAVGVKTGRAPADLAAGASVLVLVVPQSAGGEQAGSPPQAPAVVRAVALPDASGVTVVTLQLSAEAAVRIASAAGDVAIVVQSPGR